MKRKGHTGFLLEAKSVQRDILIPRYYDPDIDRDLANLAPEYCLVSIAELVRAGHVLHEHGDYVPKIHYGTGPFPYIRTSDLANWEVKASPKHGVPLNVYADYADAQKVESGDIFFVHEGTYLIGSVAMVTQWDGPMLYQHHLAKLKVLPSCPFNAYYLLAALESPLVRRQVRSKQFSADIIDSVVGRLEEVVIPFPKDSGGLRAIQQRVEEAVLGRAQLRQAVARACESLDTWLAEPDATSVRQALCAESADKTAFLGGRRGFTATALDASAIRNDILLPKYYDPQVEAVLSAYERTSTLKTLGALCEEGLIALSTGDEIGRLNYGTGDIPFVRTSDFGSWELKREAKQGVSRAVYEQYAQKQDVRAGDILLVRDGTYLVGTSVLVFDEDLPLLYCGGIYKIRSLDHVRMPPALLFALLNTPFVRRQMRNKQFTRDVIDTLGQRLVEVILPLPKKVDDMTAIAEFFDSALRTRVGYRAALHAISQDLFAVDEVSEVSHASEEA